MTCTDNYIPTGKIGQMPLSRAAFNWFDVLDIAARELRRTGEADAARVTLRAGRQTVRQFLRERFGIVTGPRLAWHRENWTPDRADLHDFLRALSRAR